MHKRNALLLIFFFLLFTGCEKKKTTDSTLPVENTTEVLGGHLQSTADTNTFKVSHQNENRDNKHTNIPKHPDVFTDTFTLSNSKNKHYTATIMNQKMTLKENTKAITLITFFATWCPPCKHQLSQLNVLQKKYHAQVFIAGVVVHDSISTEKLNVFLAKEQVQYYVSQATQNNDFASLTAKTLHLSQNYAIPLTVMYVEGKYFTHYEDVVPIEMMEYDIEEALKTKTLK